MKTKILVVDDEPGARELIEVNYGEFAIIRSQAGLNKKMVPLPERDGCDNNEPRL